jgi:hypothetical protein
MEKGSTSTPTRTIKVGDTTIEIGPGAPVPAPN